MPPLIGISGKIGAGKNFIASLLEQRGWRTLDLDRVGHEVLDSLSAEIADEFGTHVLLDKGGVDRRALGNMVFENPEKLLRLESMLYPLIVEKTDQWLNSEDKPAVIHAVHLHKTSYPERCNAIIWVWAPFWLRRRRVMARDKRNWRFLKGRFRSQKTLNSKLLCSRAEIYRVGNFGKVRQIERRVDHILRRLATRHTLEE